MIELSDNHKSRNIDKITEYSCLESIVLYLLYSLYFHPVFDIEAKPSHL